MTISGLDVTAAICVIEIEDVLLARIASSGQNLSKFLKIFSFKSKFSVAASTTKLAYSTPSCKLVYVVMLLRVRCLSSSVIRSLATILSKFLVIVAIPFFNEFSETSISCTL